MVPNFALSLSFEGISLLRRVKSGWARIEDVPLGDADFDAAMARLRERAMDLDSRGDKVLLVIPNEQIRYLDLPDFGGDASSRDAAARAGLDGATPYAVEELAYDHSHAGGRMFVAAVARETLDEAEGFATTHGFVPMGFVAIAPEGSFDGVVWFGPASDLGKRKVQKPHRAMTIVKADRAALRPADPPKPKAPKPVPAAARIKAEEPLEVPELPVKPGLATGETRSAEEGTAATAPETPQAPAPISAAHAALQANAAQAAAKDESQDEAQSEPLAEDVASVAFSSRRSSPEPTPKVTPPKADKLGSAPIKPRFTPIAPPPKSVEPPAPPFSAKAAAAPEAPNAPETAPVKDNFATRLITRRGLRQASKEPVAPPPVDVPDAPSLSRSQAPAPKPEAPAPEPQAAAPEAKPVEPVTSTESSEPDAEVQAPDSPPMAVAKDAPSEAASKETAAPLGKKARGRFAALRPKPKPKARPAASAPSVTSDEERERLTVFGARNSEKIGGKPRFLGLFLTLGLLLFLVGVAAWATVFLDSGIAQLFRSEPEQPTAVAVVQDPPAQQPAALSQPAPETEATALAPAAPVAPSQDSAEATQVDSVAAAIAEADAVADAILDTAGTDTQEPSEAQEDLLLAALEGPAEPLPELPSLSRPIIPRALTREEAAATYAATGIWQRSPIAPRFPPTDGVEQVYVASIDPSVQQFDAVAIPQARRIAPEAGIADPGLPPPPDLRFDFDPRGVVRATPEGALSPDGLRIFTGRPPVIPPLSREAALTPPATDSLTDISPQPEALNPLATFRPSARPSNLLEQRERAELGGISRNELSAIRPLLRPRTAQEEAQSEEPDSPATAQAVARSLIPVARPRNMAAIVRRAEQQPPQEVRTAAAVAPRTVNPSGPTATSVSRAATETNAINLSKVSLIGVWGTASQRRALVRLPNGKYENVKSGDRLDGGRVTAIGEGDLRYTKGGRSVTLKLPRS